jgi:hypothetical protein
VGHCNSIKYFPLPGWNDFFLGTIQNLIIDSVGLWEKDSFIWGERRVWFWLEFGKEGMGVECLWKLLIIFRYIWCFLGWSGNFSVSFKQPLWKSL